MFVRAVDSPPTGTSFGLWAKSSTGVIVARHITHCFAPYQIPLSRSSHATNWIRMESSVRQIRHTLMRPASPGNWIRRTLSLPPAYFGWNCWFPFLRFPEALRTVLPPASPMRQEKKSFTPGSPASVMVNSIVAPGPLLYLPVPLPTKVEMPVCGLVEQDAVVRLSK